MSTTLSFRRAESGDTAAAQQAYRRIVGHLAETVDFPHWHTENHPTPDEVVGWVAAGELYLALGEDGEVAGVTVLNHDAVDAYQNAAWAVEAAPDEVLVVHALGVVPGRLGQGVSRFLVDATLDVAREQGCKAVRLDTYVENIPARKLYERYGFTDLGCHTVAYEGTDLSRFHLFEYVL
ncbi:GNAT family N-acetyltransferase [Gordonia sp. HY002]|uniref:GNAT family N-acetyltransferase n=1 Tax=Gordonia zhenghanii TaxID=2911516 RepID=UPI001EEF9AE5|nr:GNAT family N-acetyltransferase [Gordonia zhenghanii]MCF8569511.1 GNAT family N-acetyltransferase [Gordonia zhenghanii]MCF8603908.1 GNAT family N-acetyltransferase [Gordonia zhenghanii]